MSFQGTVQRKLLSRGSKSEHIGMVLRCAEGTYTLRRMGGNAFCDPVLEALEGKTLRGEGIVRNGVLILRQYDVIE